MSLRRQQAARAVFGLVCLFLFAASGSTANAGSLALNPVRLALSAQRPVSALTVRNDGSEPTVVQLDVAQWTQSGGKDVYTATSEVVATPPIFTVPPGGSQLVRIGLRHPADSGGELAFRLFLQEVPPPPAPGFKGLRVAVRFAVPIFIAAPAAEQRPAVAAQPLEWHAHVAGSSSITLNIVNRGARHVRLSELSVSSQAGSKPLGKHPAPEYVMAGQNRDWSIDTELPPRAGTSLHFTAASDTGPVEADVTLEGP